MLVNAIRLFRFLDLGFPSDDKTKLIRTIPFFRPIAERDPMMEGGPLFLLRSFNQVKLAHLRKVTVRAQGWKELCKHRKTVPDRMPSMMTRVSIIDPFDGIPFLVSVLRGRTECTKSSRRAFLGLQFSPTDILLHQLTLTLTSYPDLRLNCRKYHLAHHVSHSDRSQGG